MHIQDWFSKKRTDLGYSLEELSTLSGLASSQIHNIEHGESKITINAIVRLCFGLDVHVKEFLRRINTPYPGMDIDTEGKPNDELPFITIVDIENLLPLYNQGDYTNTIKNFLCKSFYEIIQLAPPKFSRYQQKAAAYDAVEKCLSASTSKSYPPLPFPEVLDTDYYYLISTFGGAFLPHDFGAYLKSIRKTKLEYSVRKMGELLEMSHSTISRIESGESDLSLFSDLYKIEIILGQSHQWVMPGYLLLCRWLVEEFKTGIIRNRYYEERETPPRGWDWYDYVLADTLIRLNRWYQKYELEDYWMKALRTFIKKLKSGEIPPSTKDENFYSLTLPVQTKPTKRKDSNVEEMKKLFKKIQEGEISINPE